MTETMIDFQDLIEKSTDGDWLREMISFAAQRLMDLEVGAFAAPASASAATTGPITATAIAIDVGRRAPASSMI